MALKATICRADLSISDMVRNYYHDHSMAIARHPSENDERMMVRLLAFALHADEALSFGEKIGGDDEPDLWLRDATGAIDLWIDVGQPEEKQVRKACGKARQVVVYAYSGHAVPVWWRQVKDGLGRLGNLTVVSLQPAAAAGLAELAQRSMKLQCSVQEGQAWVTGGERTVQVELTMLMRPSR